MEGPPTPKSDIMSLKEHVSDAVVKIIESSDYMEKARYVDALYAKQRSGAVSSALLICRICSMPVLQKRPGTCVRCNKGLGCNGPYCKNTVGCGSKQCINCRRIGFCASCMDIQGCVFCKSNFCLTCAFVSTTHDTSVASNEKGDGPLTFTLCSTACGRSAAATKRCKVAEGNE